MVGDTWDYSEPGASTKIPPGGGWPTLTLKNPAAQAIVPIVVNAPSGVAGTSVLKNKRTATVTLTWTDNSDNETGFLVQRAFDAGFTSGVVNATVGANITTLKQDVSRGGHLLLQGARLQRHHSIRMVEYCHRSHTAVTRLA